MAGPSKLVPVLAGVAVVGVIWYNLKRQLWFARYSSVKLPPIYNQGLILPVLGAAAQFLSDPLAMARKAEKQYGDVFTVEVFGQRLTFMVGPEAQENIFKARDDELSQKEAYEFTVPTFGEGIIYDADLEKRTEQIKLVTNSLHTQALTSYVPMMKEEAELYFNQWGDSGEVDLYQALSELIILTASRCLMGKEIRNELFAEVSELYALLDKGLTPISFFAPYLPIPPHWKRDKARIQMCKLFEGVMQRRIAENRTENDVLQVFMDAIYKNGTKLPASEVTGLMICLLFAGQHTSSVTSTWTGLYILQNKEKVMKELLEEQEHAGKEIDHEAIKNMPILHACVSEALRLQPPLIFLMRQVMEDREYDGMTIPKGDKVFVSPSLAGRRADVFTNPDEYDPLRFLAPREEQRKFPHGWLGFGGGRHRCIGEQFAYLQIKTIWAYLLRNFDIEMEGDMPEPNYEALVVGPQHHQCKVKYTRRKTPLV